MNRLLPACMVLPLVLSISCSEWHAASAPPHAPALLAAHVSPSRLKSSIASLASFGTRHTLADATSTTRGIGAARAWIKSEFDKISAESGGRLKVEYQEVHVTQPTDRIPGPTTIVNVLATLPGTAPEADRRVFIVSGHYDSRVADVTDATSEAPGANDDGSGTALVLEAARVLCAGGQSYRRTIVFACVAGEEQGLNGSAGLVAKARAENWPVEAMLNNDIVGNSVGGSGQTAGNTVRVFSEGVPTTETPLQLQLRQTYGGENDGPSRQLSRYIAEIAMEIGDGFTVKQTYRRDRYGRGGDHIPFLRQGYTAVRFTEAYENFSRQHAGVTVKDGKREGDLPEYVDYDYLASVTKINVATLASLALAPAAPRNVTIDPGLSYDASLSWDPVPGATHYAVRYRETDAKDWSYYGPMTKETHVTLPNLSKDDYMFAIEASDAGGHTSLPTVPVPRRPRR